MLDADIKVIRTMEDARFNAGGTSTPMIRVEYLVGPHGPFIDRFPKDTYTAAVRDDRLNTWAREVRTP